MDMKYLIAALFIVSLVTPFNNVALAKSSKTAKTKSHTKKKGTHASKHKKSRSSKK